MAPDRPVILFIAEAVTLAHFARVVTLARLLDPAAYDVVVASDPRYLALETPLASAFHPIRSIASADFLRALAQGRPLYDANTLTGYVEEDLALLDKVKPDLVIGDFRLSLAVSAPLRRVPYAALVNAYWSPFADTPYPVPDLPMTRLLGVNLAQKLFNAARPVAFALHTRPLNKVRRAHGLASLGHDLRTVYTWGNFTLYADIAEAMPVHGQPDNHRYLGPVLWSTKTPLPQWWHALPQDKPVVFISLGSSGRADLLPEVVHALADVPVTIMASTAGKVALAHRPPNVFVTDYLPVDTATARSRLVITNGGSLTTYQALSAGVPVLGIAANMDQLLNMHGVERLGAGITLRASALNGTAVGGAAVSLLENPRYARAAEAAAGIIRQYDTAQRLRSFVREVVQ